MTLRSFSTPPNTNSTGSGVGILQHGWHILRITEPTVAMSNGTRRVVFTVVSVSPHSAGQDLRNCRFSIDHKIYDALGFATRAPAHDDEDDAAIVAALDQRVFRAQCKPQKNDAKHREIGWPYRPTDDELVECAEFINQVAQPAPKGDANDADDEIPF